MNRILARINLDRLVENFLQIKKTLGNPQQTKIMAVVKADAYGHGAVEIARTLSQQGVEYFGVACLQEAKDLLTSQIQGNILIFSEPSIPDSQEFLNPQLIHTVYTKQYIDYLGKVAAASGKNIRVHLKVDTGMHRLGVFVEEVAEYVDYIDRTKGLILEGIFTHFCCADELNNPINLLQAENFLKIKKQYTDRQLLFHCESSNALLNFPAWQFDLVRAGISLYKNVMTIVSYINSVKVLKKGESVSYGATFTAPKDLQIAIVSAGYADGIRRDLSNCGEVLIKGQRFPIIGTICMDMLMIDISGRNDFGRGEEVVIFGSQGKTAITAEEVATKLGTIDYEILCAISKRVKRIY